MGSKGAKGANISAPRRARRGICQATCMPARWRYRHSVPRVQHQALTLLLLLLEMLRGRLQLPRQQLQRLHMLLTAVAGAAAAAAARTARLAQAV